MIDTSPEPWQNDDYTCKGCGAYQHPVGMHNERCRQDCPEVARRREEHQERQVIIMPDFHMPPEIIRGDISPYGGQDDADA